VSTTQDDIAAAGPPGGADPALDDLLDLASAQELGELLAAYWPATRFGLVFGWFLLALLPFPFLAGTAPVRTFLVVGAVFWPVAVRGLLRSPVLIRGVGEKRIYLYERGFVHADAKGALDLFRWNQIDTVFESVNRWTPVFVKPRIRCLITRYDGKTIALTNMWSGIGHLVGETSRHVTRAQLPVVRAALERGQRVQFGKIIVDAAGVTGPHRSAPWAEIKVQGVETGRMRLLAGDSLSALSSTPTSRIPNLRLFLQIIRIYQQNDTPPQ
jgi:hypothetical protein